jgi:hypothetical protein
MPKKAKKAAPKAKAKVDKKYGYLPKDLQQVGQYMDRVAFLRSLQKKQAVRQYAHVASQTDGPGSGLSEHGAVGLGEKIDRAVGPLLKAKPKSGAFGKPTPLGRFASSFARGRSRSPRVAAEAGSSTQPMRYDPGLFAM